MDAVCSVVNQQWTSDLRTVVPEGLSIFSASQIGDAVLKFLERLFESLIIGLGIRIELVQEKGELVGLAKIYLELCAAYTINRHGLRYSRRIYFRASSCTTVCFESSQSIRSPLRSAIFPSRHVAVER